MRNPVQETKLQKVPDNRMQRTENREAQTNLGMMDGELLGAGLGSTVGGEELGSPEGEMLGLWEGTWLGTLVKPSPLQRGWPSRMAPTLSWHAL